MRLKSNATWRVSLNNATTDLDETYHALKRIPDDATCARRSPTAWSRREILGHLCDSAINNYWRLMQLHTSPETLAVVKYDQRMWVDRAAYQQREWLSILDLWFLLNKSLQSVLNTAEAAFLARRIVVEEQELTVQWLVDDYIEHMQHHLRQIYNYE